MNWRVFQVRIDDCSLYRETIGANMSKVDHRNIDKVPNRCGGRAVIAGSRIRVSVILACHRQGMTVEEMVTQYPNLGHAEIDDALAYAAEHPAEIEADLLADDEDTVQRLQPKRRWWR